MAGQRRSPTQVDVARRARVSQATVSLVISGGAASSQVAEKTRRQVLEAAAELGYTVNAADDLVVMYAGRVAERGPAREVLDRPRHPYTRALANNVPSVRTTSAIAEPLPGAPANPFDRPAGCAFHPRCPMARDCCRTDTPALDEVEPGRFSACHFADEVVS